MTRTIVYWKKSTKPEKKFMVRIDNKTVFFGQRGASDYTIHKDPERKQRYIVRHKRGNENWGKSGIKTAGWWSRWALWNKPSLAGSKRDISKRFNVTFKKGWPKTTRRH
jgi:hypothetical protein